MINIIAAIQKKDRGLGFQNKLLFRLKDDLKNFKQLTLGQIIIMGRKTYDSIGHPLRERTNIVVTKNKNFQVPQDTIVAFSLEEALEEAKKINKQIFIIGGGEIYSQAIGLADRLYITLVDSNFEVDVFFPPYEDKFSKIISEKDIMDEKTKIHYKMLILEK